MEEIKYNKDGSIAKKRGRPKKVKKELSELIDSIKEDLKENTLLEIPKIRTYDEVINAENEMEDDDEKEVHQIIEEAMQKKKGEWDIKKTDPISFFDASLSYELTGYKPIDNEHSLDFDPNWFTETRDKFLKTNHYCLYPRKTKAFNDFWDELYLRCRNGMTVNGYTITGDHYFFLNFYLLDILTGTDKAGGGRKRSFPQFFVELYKYFHYLELCKRLRKNCVLMKARGIGQ